MQLLLGNKTDFLFVAASGPGETDAKGLIVPKFGNKSENRVAIGMTFDALSQFFLLTQIHYQAWLIAWYIKKPVHQQSIRGS